MFLLFIYYIIIVLLYISGLDSDLLILLMIYGVGHSLHKELAEMKGKIK